MLLINGQIMAAQFPQLATAQPMLTEEATVSDAISSYPEQPPTVFLMC